MGDNLAITGNTVGENAHVHQVYVKGRLSVTNNYGISHENTDKRDGEDEILRRLYTSPYEDRKDRNPPRVPGTCEWFTSHELFKDWEESRSSRLLWVSADPGCGKSVLVKHLVDTVLQTTESRTVCYFFFKDDFPDQRSVVSALSCILRQIFIKKPLLLSDRVLHQFSTGGETFFNSFTELWKILIQVSEDQGAGEIICILDAIDECDEKGSQLTQELCKLYGAANDCHLKFLLTSRPYGRIYRGFRPLEIPGLPVIHLSGESDTESQKISQEIDIFIRFKVQDIGKRLKLQEEERNLLLKELMKIPHRTYLWVYLTLDLIESDIIVDRTISNAASCIPKTVDEAYERILSKSCDFDQAKKILHIVVAAARPLTLEEMNLALALSTSHRSNDDIKLKPEERFHQELRDTCGLFITIIGSKIYLLHQTAKEFLLADKPNPPTDVFGHTTWKHSLNLPDSHHILIDICTLYLCNLKSDSNLKKGIKASCLRAEDMILLDYSARYWVTHFHGLHIKTQKEKTGLILKLCDVESEHCQMWFKAYWTSTNTEFPKGFTSLMITAYFGLQEAFQSLVETGIDLNCQDDTYQRSALFWAVRNDFHVIAKLLIKGARVKKGLIKLPWRKKAKVNQVDKYGRTPLSYAVWNGNTTIAEMLLKAGALAHLKDELGGTPISYAYLDQNERMINILLQKKNEGDIKNDINNLLFSAAEKGHEEVVELVLKTSKVSPNARNQDGQTPLLCAAREGRGAVTKVLLERGADPNCRDTFNQTPLIFAIDKGNVAIIKALLERGADPNGRDYITSWTPLKFAIDMAKVAVVNALLQGGADPNYSGTSHQTPLNYAIYRAKVAVVNALLQGGADPNYSGTSNQTPLNYAIYRAKVAVVNALLQGGADPNSRDTSNQTPLIYAIAKGNAAIIKALLERGANPNYEDNLNGTPLLYAIQEGYVEIVKVLLEGGAGPNFKNVVGKTPLLVAIDDGNVAIVKALLDMGADYKMMSTRHLSFMLKHEIIRQE
ncbi:ankyrin repeat-containing domain protein [Trichoderma sp. SZMC 28014]